LAQNAHSVCRIQPWTPGCVWYRAYEMLFHLLSSTVPVMSFSFIHSQRRPARTILYCVALLCQVHSWSWLAFVLVHAWLGGVVLCAVAHRYAPNALTHDMAWIHKWLFVALDPCTRQVRDLQESSQ
jgi:hypothetical protein